MLEPRAENKSSLSVESGSSGTGHSSHSRGLAWTPPASVEGSTPTWTEGTPSFTESSSSGDIGKYTRHIIHDCEKYEMKEECKKLSLGCPTTPLRRGTNTPAISSQQQKKVVDDAMCNLATEMVSSK